MAMEKSTRAELIAALVTDKHSGFKDGDEAILEAASDARLEEFRTAAEAVRAKEGTITRMETEQRNTSARLKVAEDRLKIAEQPISDEDFVAKLAPTSPIKAVLEARAAEETSLKTSLVSQLKDLGANTEEDLKKKSIDELKTLAKYARVEVIDFSGKGIPANRAASDQPKTFAPPDPYAEGLKQIRTAAAK